MIEVSNLLKTFDGGKVRAVDEISFQVPAGQVLTLLGPSGCGKTTTMRSVAGLEKPDSGEIQIGERVVFAPAKRVNLRPNQRKVGMVFQSYAIWPHMTVYNNVSYPLKGNRLDRGTIKERTMRALRLVGLEELAARRAPNLSGGQQQRVALARALVAEPEVLLLDEPLSNLDAKLRDTMRQEIRELQQTLGITTLYVTHDQTEALAISDLVAVMSKGRIIDFGPPDRIYSRPRSRAVAEFIGMANVVEATGVRRDGSNYEGQSNLGPITFFADSPPGDRCSILVRLEDIELVGEQSAGMPNVWPAKVVSSLYLGGYVECVFEVGGQRINAQVSRRNRPTEGTTVNVRVDPSSCYVLPEDDDEDVPSGAFDPEGAASARAVTA